MRLSHGDLITVVLQYPGNVREGESRLVHTTVFDYRAGEVMDGRFLANDDDRVEHRTCDQGITWLLGHVALDSPEAGELVRHAEEEDVRRRGKEEE